MVKSSHLLQFIHPKWPKIYNNQLIRYAGYDKAGDPSEKK